MKNLVFIAIIIALVAVIIFAQKEKYTDTEEPTATSTEEVVEENTEETEETETEEESLIVVTSPVPGENVGDPLEVSGQARGYWYFEASAPVVVTNWDGLIIGEGYITADGDWMTEDFVPFSGTIDYELPANSYSATGTIIFERANPSGLPENAAAFEMQVQLQSS